MTLANSQPYSSTATTEQKFRSVIEEHTYTDGDGDRMSAPSSGSSKVHPVEQQEIIDEAFAP